jgi:putative FmdB family regulatory protein
MALYSYRCKDCNTMFDEAHGMNDTKKIKCVRCGSYNTYKRMTFGNFILKCNGFYSTDKT